MSNQGAVLENRDIGMRAFGYDVPAVQNRFVNACLLGGLRGKNVRKQIERFDVTMIITCVFQCDATERAVNILNASRLQHDPQIGRRVLRKNVGSRSGSAAELEVNPKVTGIHASNQGIQELTKFRPRYVRNDL